MDITHFKSLVWPLAGVLILILFTLLAPVYLMDDGSSERFWVWNAPTRPNPQSYDRLTPDVIAHYSNDPIKRNTLEAMKKQPSIIPHESNYFGPITGPGFNVLGYFTALCLIVWCCFAGYHVRLYLREKKEWEDLPASWRS